VLAALPSAGMVSIFGFVRLTRTTLVMSALVSARREDS
jgi:hypothetical protein